VCRSCQFSKIPLGISLVSEDAIQWSRVAFYRRSHRLTGSLFGSSSSKLNSAHHVAARRRRLVQVRPAMRASFDVLMTVIP
jgi:hypothetical protein